ncbi:hypothetical protein AYY20_07735 [Photobacterium aquimaris]|uniref:HGGxSTG domain-containing protein n=1 Tax=Photobacterium aquimaris TaxID=512643 RepID=UPI0007EF7FDF|nr:HGGxSTG domain-containing protein [Photobacterium aquimaris]OBU14751.1 hypothetical protein AYY20_07735 [Photobacterium aquimaris]
MFNKNSNLCCAKNKDGSRCAALLFGKNKRCYKHGGASTGPMTELGKLISSKNSRKKNTKLVLFK